MDAQKMVEREVLLCQTSLVEKLLEVNLVDWEDIQNAYYGEEEPEQFDELKEVFSWWLVSAWLASKLVEALEPVLLSEYGTWWGRTTCGSAIYQDDVIKRIAESV